MPVDDHPVHPSTIAKEFYGCKDREPFKDFYFAPNRKYVDRNEGPEGSYIIQQKQILRTSSDDCKYDTPNDPMCGNCKWKMLTA